MPERAGAAGYDYRPALEAADHYRAATGVACLVIDSRGEIQDSHEYGTCGLCNLLYGTQQSKDLCRKTHLYGSYQSERFGGRYHYFCPGSLLHWASPIMYEGSMRGALIAGPALLFEPEELIRDLLDEHGSPEIPGLGMNHKLKRQEIRTIISGIEKISPSRAHSLGEILFYTTASISDDTRFSLEQNSELLQQQSRISEYIHHIKTMEGNEKPDIDYPITKERELLHLISRGDKKNAQAVLNEILGSVFFSSGRDFEVVKSRVLELAVLLSRAALEGGADIEQIFGLNYNYLSQIHSFRNLDDLAYWLSKIMGRFTDLVFDLKDVKHTDAIYKAIQYIHEHYAEKITLEDVASQVYLSPAYFSKVFRQEVGSTFISYLNQVRIERSKILLQDRTIQLVEIAGLVGYEDQSYFTKVFKKFTGIPPGRYRESWRAYPKETHEIHEEDELTEIDKN